MLTGSGHLLLGTCKAQRAKPTTGPIAKLMPLLLTLNNVETTADSRRMTLHALQPSESSGSNSSSPKESLGLKSKHIDVASDGLSAGKPCSRGSFICSFSRYRYWTSKLSRATKAFRRSPRSLDSQRDWPRLFPERLAQTRFWLFYSDIDDLRCGPDR